jgi:hypothetical protein
MKDLFNSSSRIEDRPILIILRIQSQTAVDRFRFKNLSEAL